MHSSTIILTFGDLRSIAEAVNRFGHVENDFSIKLIDIGPEIVVRDLNDMFITNWKKIHAVTNDGDHSSE